MSTILSRPAARPPGDPQLRMRDEKLEALKAVVGKLAHDFNNFLVPQFGYLTLLKEELPEASTGAQYASTMEATGRRTEAYIDLILLGMRPHRQFSPAAFSLSGLLENSIDQWMGETAPGTVIQVRRSIEDGMLFGDERHWKNAIAHLLSNARYALATGGELEVELKRVRLDGEKLVRLGMMRDEVYKLVLRDGGFGMSPEVAARAFEPFFTTRTQIKAAGLGLTIVHSVAQFHGGQVELQSAEEQGTTITLWIPVDGVSSRERLASISGRSRPTSAPGKKVLLIGDDPLVNEVLRDWLGRFEYEVHVAVNQAEAAKTFERKRAEWSLVIIETDLRLGRGEDIYHRLQPLEPAIPWIFLAGRRRPEVPCEDANERSAPLVMQKPVTLRALGAVVRRQCELQH